MASGFMNAHCLGYRYTFCSGRIQNPSSIILKEGEERLILEDSVESSGFIEKGAIS